MSNADKPAYPMMETFHNGFDHAGDKTYLTNVEGGLTKRELFAKDIACQLVREWSKVNIHYVPASEVDGIRDLCIHAIEIADELLKQLESCK